MNEDDVVDLLDRLGADVRVRSAPVDRIFKERSRLHRRRITWTVLGSAAATTVIVTASVAVAQGWPSAQTPSTHVPSAAQHAHSGMATPTTPPPGKRLVGVGHASIAVPQGWGTNQITCGPTSATTNTVVFNVTVFAACAAGLAPRASVAEVAHASDLPPYPGFTPARHISIDGHPALRTRIICRFEGVKHPPCTGAVFIVSESASFQVTSHHASIVAHLLDSIHVDQQRVAVPESHEQVYDPDGADRFVAAAQALGLKVVITTGPAMRSRPGGIISVLPYPGTVLAPGDTIHLTVAPMAR
jgi:hypothetical protein